MVEENNSSASAAVAALDAAVQSDTEKFDDLMRKMHAQRQIFLVVMKRCIEPQESSRVHAIVDDMQKDNASVYDAANLCVILEGAGALKRVFEDGSFYEDFAVEPNIVEIDGIEYYEPTDPPLMYWQTTDFGREKVDQNDPDGRLLRLIEEESLYVPIYRRVLELAAREEGARAEDLAASIDGDPLVQKPRYFAPRFVDRLEKCEAIEWHGAWKTTEVGRTALDRLSQMSDSRI